MKENIEEDIEILKSIDCLDDIELEQAIKAVTTELERLQKEHTDLTAKMLDWRNKSIKLEAENEELKEYKRISELTKISCCTAQNCGALSNSIRDSLENEKLKKENEELKGLIAHKNRYTEQLEQDLFENASNYVISKQKITDKIEEVKNEEDLYARGNIIAILLELLEEEKQNEKI